MASYTGSFTAVGQLSPELFLRKGQTVRYALSGTFNATVILEEAGKGKNSWRAIASFTAGTDTNLKNQTQKPLRLRFRVAAYTSGTASYTLQDVDDDTIFELYLEDGRPVIGVRDDGSFYVLGTEFSGGGGGSSVPDGTNQGDILAWDTVSGWVVVPVGTQGQYLTPDDFAAVGGLSWTNLPAADVDWGAIGGAISSQADLQAALDAKLSALGSSTDRALITWNGTGGDAFRNNIPTIDSSGNLHGNRDGFAVYGGNSDYNRITISDAAIGFNFNTGVPLQTFDGSFTTYYPDHYSIFGTGAGTGGTFYFLGANTNGFNTAINGVYGAGNNTGANQGGSVHLRPGTSASGDDGYALLGLASRGASANGGFPYVPTISGSGTPSGTPTAVTGFCPFGYQPATDKWWVYNGSAWKSVTLS